ncbi:glutaredoxin domain-containing protein [Herbiconiux sp. YIM B11900]|uniref:glutaredoxin domain-containing protein n=1 Tax=Herbiconiux sp. YIM B11900 TaxID=3404131 RepID=UPI003F845492
MTAPTITVYTKSNCRQCEATKRYFGRNALTYAEVDLEQSPGDMAAVKALGYQEAPVVIASLDGVPGNEVHWSGFNPGRIDSLVAA